MRCWHKSILEYLPELQLKSQWRELVLMAKDLHEKGSTNHLLINQIMLYNKDHFNAYVYYVYRAMISRRKIHLYIDMDGTPGTVREE